MPTLSTRIAAIHLATMPRSACIVAAGKFGDSYCLLKNRDRNYLPEVTVVHEVRDGVEVAYFQDASTGWVEGLNEFGIGIVNAALMVSRDETERDEVERTGKKLKDGERILKALTEKTVDAAAKSARTYKDGLKGHTIISDGKKTLYVEMPDSNDVEFDEVPLDELFVRTNHGIEFPDAGYVDGKNEKSSKTRQEAAEEVLAKVKSPEDVAPSLLRAREDRWEPTEMVRDNKSDRKMRTTSQMVLDLTEKKLTFYVLPGRIEFKGVKDKLPKGHEPKLTVEVREYDDLSEDTDGETKKMRTASLLPILDPAFNIREIFKQLVLLEDHLFHPRKQCPDCIWKHLLTCEAFAEEGVTLDLKRKYTGILDGLAERIRGLARAVQDEEPFDEIAQKAREIRKSLLGVASTLRVASEVPVPDSQSFAPFKVGDYITYGKFQNKPGQIVRLFVNEQGIPSIEIAAVGHARRKNRIMGLFRIRHTDMTQRVATRWAGSLLQFPTRAAPVRPKHTVVLGGKKYALSADGGPLGDQLEALSGGDEGGARVVDVPAFMRPEPYRFLWAYDTEDGSVSMWRVTDGNSKVWGTADGFAMKILELDRKGELNRVTSAEMAKLDRAMRKKENEQLQSMKKWLAENATEYQTFVDKVAWDVFNRDVKPGLDKRLQEAKRGVVPIGFKVDESQLEYRPRGNQLRSHILTEETAKFTMDKIEDEVRKRGVDPEAPGHDIQAAYWAMNDVVQEVWEKYSKFKIASDPLVGALREVDAYLVEARKRWDDESSYLDWVQETIDPLMRAVRRVDALWTGVPSRPAGSDPEHVRDVLEGGRWVLHMADGGYSRLVLHGPGEGGPTMHFEVGSASSKTLPKWNQLVEQGLATTGGHIKVAEGKYKEKKEVPKADGKGTTTVYVYSEKQIEHRHREKAKRYEGLSKDIEKLRKQVTKDIDSDDPKTRLTALAIGLIDATFERVGNDGSADDGHFGVTGWLKKHLTFGKGKATIKYVGKSGVDHEKVVDDAKLVKALKGCCEDKKPDEAILSFGADDDAGPVKISSRDVNAYLKPFDVTAKDLRGFHANREMQEALRSVRKKGPTLPSDKKEKEKLLKDEFKKALELTAEAVGHEAATLRTQYLVPGLEDAYMKDGTIMDKLKGASSNRVAALWLQATKSEAEREDEEVERLSRPVPKKKPSRDDSKRERIETEKEEPRDPDLSRNYKDV